MAFIERYAVRPFVQRGSDNWLMATVAVGIIVDNLMLFVFGKEPRGFHPRSAASRSGFADGAGVYPLQLLIPVIGLLLATAFISSHGARVTGLPCLPSCRIREPPS